jgi:Fic family protein
MTKLTEVLKEIDSLKDQLDKLKPLKKEDEERLWKKFRLEWNYNSNHIEGNTLTYNQTELLLIFDKTTGDHEMREYEEMKNHDVAIKLVREYANDVSRELTEADIREFNKIILVRPFWGNAQTADGQSTRKLIQPGEYKKEPNSVKLQNGEMFHYASPEETPAKMNELMNWFRKVLSEKKLHPAQIAAQLHYDFVRIHPFDDSNGRTSRLLMNYVLLRNGFPPVIIKASDKKGYLTALNKADVGDLDSFVVYILDQLKWSLELNAKVARGQSIEEIDDVDKEIDVWKRSLKKPNLEISFKTKDLIAQLSENSVLPVFNLFFEKHSNNFDELFASHIAYIIHDEDSHVLKDKKDIASRTLNHIKRYTDGEDFIIKVQNWRIEFQFNDPKIIVENKFRITSTLSVTFGMNYYEFRHNGTQLIVKAYQIKQLTMDEIAFIVNQSIKKVFDEVKKQFGTQ